MEADLINRAFSILRPREGADPKPYCPHQVIELIHNPIELGFATLILTLHSHPNFAVRRYDTIIDQDEYIEFGETNTEDVVCSPIARITRTIDFYVLGLLGQKQLLQALEFVDADMEDFRSPTYTHTTYACQLVTGDIPGTGGRPKGYAENDWIPIRFTVTREVSPKESDTLASALATMTDDPQVQAQLHSPDRSYFIYALDQTMARIATIIAANVQKPLLRTLPRIPLTAEVTALTPWRWMGTYMDPWRRILSVLSATKPLPAFYLTESTGLTRSVTSRNLKRLEEIGLVKHVGSGREVEWLLSPSLDESDSIYELIVHATKLDKLQYIVESDNEYHCYITDITNKTGDTLRFTACGLLIKGTPVLERAEKDLCYGCEVIVNVSNPGIPCSIHQHDEFADHEAQRLQREHERAELHAFVNKLRPKDLIGEQPPDSGAADDETNVDD